MGEYNDTSITFQVLSADEQECYEGPNGWIYWERRIVPIMKQDLNNGEPDVFKVSDVNLDKNDQSTGS